MKIRMIKTTIALFFMIAGTTTAWSQQTNCYILNGETFPDIVFQSILSKQNQKYLGISDSQREMKSFTNFYSFALADTEADLIIIELINIHCFSCQKQAPIMNAIYNLIDLDHNLKTKVKILAICPGNTFREVKKFKKQYSVPFPVIPDPQFEIYEVIGKQCGTPFILMAKKK
jgi:peroxiredoxin